MSDIPVDLQAHLQNATTTLCHCWRVERRDGAVLGFTDHDMRLVVSGEEYEPRTGLSASEARQSLGMAVDTTDVEGALSSDAISEADIEAGRYDGATVETLLVNWREPAQHAAIRKATVGKITRRDGAFAVELESAASLLDRPVGRTYRKTCDAELGDARCGFLLSTPGYAASGSAAAAGSEAIVATGLSGFASGWFEGGVLTWTSGGAAGRQDRVSTHIREDAAVSLSLRAGTPADVAPGDSFEVVAGCDKRFGTCKEKFANHLNFRGFPHLPGNDAAYAYVREGVDFDGGTLTP